MASQVRELIIGTVSKNGGHLAPSLGTVELTIALLRCCDLDSDHIVWDVGHQSYAYKILTDRLSSFHTLRTYKGISGFIKPGESPYDVCTSGHTSVSISDALGIAAGKNIQGKNSKTIAVIGDGAMSGGIAFEALNNLGVLKKNLIVILNDNEMSINHNVGAFAGYLSGTLTGDFAMKLKKDIQNIFEDAPLGGKLLSFAKKVESSVISFFTPGSFFENLGIKYIGPVNGHKIKDIEKAISNALLQDGPVLIHTATVKGKGYKYAENCPDIFHGVPPFSIDSGELLQKSSADSWTDVFGRKIVELAQKDDRVVAVTAAMKDGTGLRTFADKFPNRFFDVGIAEQHGVAFSAGLATSGMKPFFAVYSTFLQRGFDQIIHDVAISKVPVTLCIDRAGLVGADGPTHHGAFDLSYLRLVPNIAVMLPKDGWELEQMLDIALQSDFPVAIRYPRGSVSSYSELPIQPVVFGMPEVVKSGDDVAIISVGHIFDQSYKLYTMLLGAGIRASLINLRFLKPLDPSLILDELKNKRIVAVIEEGAVNGGAGDAISSLVMDNNLNVRVMKFGLPDNFIEHGTVEELRQLIGIDARSIYGKIAEALV